MERELDRLLPREDHPVGFRRVLPDLCDDIGFLLGADFVSAVATEYRLHEERTVRVRS